MVSALQAWQITLDWSDSLLLLAPYKCFPIYPTTANPLLRPPVHVSGGDAPFYPLYQHMRWEAPAAVMDIDHPDAKRLRISFGDDEGCYLAALHDAAVNEEQESTLDDAHLAATERFERGLPPDIASPEPAPDADFPLGEPASPALSELSLASSTYTTDTSLGSSPSNEEVSDPELAFIMGLGEWEGYQTFEDFDARDRSMEPAPAPVKMESEDVFFKTFFPRSLPPHLKYTFEDRRTIVGLCFDFDGVTHAPDPTGYFEEERELEG